jgi:hypothetical protein
MVICESFLGDRVIHDPSAVQKTHGQLEEVAERWDCIHEAARSRFAAIDKVVQAAEQDV